MKQRELARIQGQHLYARIISHLRWDLPPLHIGFGQEASKKPLEDCVDSNIRSISVCDLYGYNMGAEGDLPVLEIDQAQYTRNLDDDKFEEVDIDKENIKISVDSSVRVALSGLSDFFK